MYARVGELWLASSITDARLMLVVLCCVSFLCLLYTLSRLDIAGMSAACICVKTTRYSRRLRLQVWVYMAECLARYEWRIQTVWIFPSLDSDTVD